MTYDTCAAHHRTLCFPLALLLLAACPDDTARTTADPTTAGSSSTTAEPTTSGSTTTVEPTTGSSTTGSSTTEVPTTTDTADTGTTGEPGEGGAAWVLYRTDDKNNTVPSELYFVDASGPTPGPPTPVHAPPMPGWSVSLVHDSSPLGRWHSHELGDPMVGREVWFMRIDGPTLGAPVRVDLPPQLGFGLPLYAADESLVAFGVVQTGGSTGLHLCELGDDGSCAPTLWSPPVAPGGTIRDDAASFSPDHSKLAYAGDLDGDGTAQVLLAGTAPGDAGKAVELGGIPMGLGALGTAFAADGQTLYFTSTTQEFAGGPRDLFAVDVSVDPPGPPVLVSPPIVHTSQRFRFRSDLSATLMWSSDNSLGDLVLIPLDGTQVAAPVPLHDKPGSVVTKGFAWAPGEQHVVYLAEKADDPGNNDAYIVDVSGPAPAPPVRLNAPLGPGGDVSFIVFGADASRAFYFANSGAGQGSELWMVGLSPMSAPVKLSAPLPPNGSLPGELEVAADLSRVMYSGNQESESLRELFLVELAGPAAPVKLNDPLAVGGSVGFGASFAPDGKRAFFRVQDADMKKRLFQVDLTPTPAAPVQISNEAHDAFLLDVLPPGAP